MGRPRQSNRPKTRRQQLGRPTQFRVHLAARAEQLAAGGSIQREIADGLNICEKTFYLWMEKHPKFAECVKRGQKMWLTGATTNVRRKLYERATGYEHPAVHFSNYEGDITETQFTQRYPPDTNAAKFWLTNRDPDNWKDRQSVEHSVDLRFAERLRQARQRNAGLK